MTKEKEKTSSNKEDVNMIPYQLVLWDNPKVIVESVMGLLVQVCDYSQSDAWKLCREVTEKGQGVIGIYPQDEALRLLDEANRYIENFQPQIAIAGLEVTVDIA